MYVPQEISSRIKKRAKVQNIALKDVLQNVGTGVNFVSHLSKGQEVSYLTLAKIADCLDCSVDYLLGRTDNPNSHNIPVDSGESSSSDQISAIIGVCKQLNVVDLAKVLVYADNIKNN